MASVPVDTVCLSVSVPKYLGLYILTLPGSVGGRSDNTVETILFESSEIKASQNGVRIKTIAGDTGTVSGVTYKGED